MAIKDDIPDGCTQHPPLSPQPYSDHKFDVSDLIMDCTDLIIGWTNQTFEGSV